MKSGDVVKIVLARYVIALKVTPDQCSSTLSLSGAPDDGSYNPNPGVNHLILLLFRVF